MPKITINTAGSSAISITEKVKSFEDACKVLGINDPIVLEYPTQLQHLFESTEAYTKLCIITEALNEGWTPDWNNTNQPKFYPWFDMRGEFSLYGVCDDYYDSYVSSRLCFKSRELAQYAASQFLSLYKQFFTLKS